MSEPAGRRERKKAATRRTIAEAARRLFLEHGFDAVGIRDVAAAADVAVTTVFAHFAAKEALVFEADEEFERGLVLAVTDRPAHEPLLRSLRAAIEAQVRHCTTGDAAPLWAMIDSSPALRAYESAMGARHAESLATALAADLSLPATVACRSLARFVVDAFSLAREAPDPRVALDEVFAMIEAAWAAARPVGG